MALGFRKFISKVFVNGKFPKILPSENFPLYGISASWLKLLDFEQPFHSHYNIMSGMYKGVEWGW